MKKPSRILSDWLFSTLAGAFIENGCLYTPGSHDGGAVIIPGTYNNGEFSLESGPIAGGKVYPLAVKEEVKAPYIVYDDISTRFEGTKDGRYPSEVSFRILVVAKTFNEAEEISEAVESAVGRGRVPDLGFVNTESIRCGYDSGSGGYLEEIRCLINL